MKQPELAPYVNESKKLHFILLRGLGREANHWADFKPLLQQYYPNADISCLDLPGAGIFNQVKAPLKVEQYLPFLAQQLPSFQADTKYIVIALSFGAMLALALVSKHPNCFHQLILINSSSRLSPFYQRIKLNNVVPLLWRLLSANLIQREQAIWQLTCNITSWHHVKANWLEITQQRPVSRLNMLKQLFAASRFMPPKPELISANLLIIASIDDRLVNYQCSKALASYYRTKIKYHHSAGHDLPQDDAQFLLSCLADKVSTI